MCRRAKALVQTNIGVLHKVADVLLEKEQIDGDEFQVRSTCPSQESCLWMTGCASYFRRLI
jgi:ATP-dependent Zn protease